MKALDTNILVRVILNDDPRQYPAALAALSSGDVLVTATVVLELLWVLRSIGGLSDDEMRDAVRTLAAWPSVTVVSVDRCEEFLRLWEAGLDAQDAAHLAFAGEVEAFVTFDKPFAKRTAKANSLTPVRAS